MQSRRYRKGNISKFRIDILTNGADVPYLVGGSGANGPEEATGMPSARVLCEGDVLMMDTGAVFDGYYLILTEILLLGQ